MCNKMKQNSHPTVSNTPRVLVLQKQPERLDVVHVVELRCGLHVAPAEPCRALYAQPLVKTETRETPWAR
jgi:hypothetical protein